MVECSEQVMFIFPPSSDFIVISVASSSEMKPSEIASIYTAGLDLASCLGFLTVLRQ